MKILSESPTLGPIRLFYCKCSVWPMPTVWVALTGAGRCGECGVQPYPIPEWAESA